MKQIVKGLLCATLVAAVSSLSAITDWQAIGRGYELFREKHAQNEYEWLKKLAAKQEPISIIIACIDSRVDPAVIFQSNFGKFLVLRNVANIVPERTNALGQGERAALFFATEVLNIKNIIILGHSGCGGLAHLLSVFNQGGPRGQDLVYDWVQIVSPANEQEASLPLNDYALVALNKSYDNCLTYPWIERGVNNGRITLHAWYFEIGEGKLYARYQDAEGNIDYHDLASKDVFLKEFGVQPRNKGAAVARNKRTAKETQKVATKTTKKAKKTTAV